MAERPAMPDAEGPAPSGGAGGGAAREPLPRESSTADGSYPAGTVGGDSLGRPISPLRGEIPFAAAFFWGFTCIATVLALWFVVTAGPPGEPERRMVSPLILPSPGETVQEIPDLFRRGIVGDMLVTLRRVVLGFALAAVVGVPLGVLAACFPSLRAFLAPLTMFGRNVPMAALIPYFMLAFGINEWGKVMFLFVASVAFVIADTAAAVLDVPERYVDTARTLGASRLQIITKVLVPLAAPSVFNSLRLLFGIAFGYVMLSELTNAKAGVGAIINVAQRLGRREAILVVLVLISLVAYATDRCLWWLQCDLFPYRYGGRGLIPRVCGRLLHGRSTEFRP